VTSTITDNDVGICNVQGSSSGTPVLIQGNIVSGGDESVYQDSGSSTIKDNSLTGANIGIWIPQYSGQPSSPTVTATGNVITGQASAGVQVESDGTSGDEAVVASITKSDLSGDPFGVENNSSSIVNATNDFWGDASGPSGNSFGTSTNSAVDVNVTFFPWDETTSDTPTTATVKTQKGCTSSGTNLKSSKADAVICLTGAGAAITYHGIGPVLILGNGSDDITLGSSGNPASGVSIILTAGSSVVVANSSAGVYQLQNGATATFTDGSNLTQASSPLVTG
jgi:hypothetical protein